MTETTWQSSASTSILSLSGQVSGTLNGALDANSSTYISVKGASGVLKIRITFNKVIVVDLSTQTFFRMGAVGSNCSYDAELLDSNYNVLKSVVAGPISVSGDPDIEYPFSSGGYIAGVKYLDVTLNAPDALTELKLYTANIQGLSAPDIRCRYEKSGTKYAIAAEQIINHKFRINTVDGIFGFALVDTSDSNASPFRCYDGSTIKSFAKVPLA